MTTYTLFGDLTDGKILSSDSSSSYANARAGTGTLQADSSLGPNVLGQLTSSGVYYEVDEGFLNFDTNIINDTEIVTSAVMSLYGSSDDSVTDFTINARIFDWGLSLTTADYVPGASLSSKPLFATFATSGWSTSGYNAFTTDAGGPALISVLNVTRMVIASSRTENNNTPTGNEYVGWYSADVAGTTQDPKMVVTAVPAVGFPFSAAPMQHMIVR